MKNLFLLLTTLILFNTAANAQQHFLTTWNTANSGASNSTSITIPTDASGYTYSYDVDWENDGIFDDLGVTGNITHDYGAEGIYQVAIRGTFPAIQFPANASGVEGDNDKIISIDQWGDISWETMATAFRYCSNLEYTATDAPDLTNVTSMYQMFYRASSFNGDLSNWNIENVTNLNGIFFLATSFNGDVSTWNTSNVVYMQETFRGASSFNGDLSSWNTTNVITMTFMFELASSFNSDLSAWETGNVVSMGYMFKLAGSFTSDLSAWDTENVTNMNSMFRSASSFTSDLSAWETGNVTNMQDMFYGASSFTSDLSTWDTGNVTSMRYMFYVASSFTSDLSSWNTANVTDMNSMFRSASSFTSDLSSWNTANVTDMRQMFQSAVSFSSDLGSWNISSNTTDMQQMLFLCGMSIADYDNTLIGWLAQTPPMNMNPHPSNLTFCATAARDELINTYNWVFTGDTNAADTEIEVSGNNMIITAGDDTPSTADDTDYGSLIFGDAPVSKTFTINNTGTNPLEISSIEITGVNASNFIVTAAPANSITPGSSTSFTVQFTPAPDANNTATVDIYSSDCDQTKFSFDLKAFVVSQPFLTTWNTANNPVPNNTMITIPTNSNYVYDYDVDWNNDGTFDDLGVTGNITHDYGTPGTYQVAIRGTFPAIRFPQSEVTDNSEIISIDQWGDIDWKTMESAFANCPNLGYTATDAPDLDDVTSMSEMFSGATSFNGDLSTWNTSNVTNMSSMFGYASSFNGDISNWNTESVTNMSYMFERATSFNGDLSIWNTGNVTSMFSMFEEATSFNSDLSAWNTENVNAMPYMFKGATVFNSNLGTWNISNVTSMDEMLANSNLSLDNYDNTLIGWAAQTPPTNIILGSTASLTYCAGAIARDELINDYGWWIWGDAPSDMGSEIDIKGNNIDIVDGDDSPSKDDGTDFGSMPPNAPAISQTFTIDNPSAIPLDISNIAITGADAASFSIISPPSNTVASGGNTTFVIEFSPNTIGLNNAAVEITNTDCGEALYNFDLKAVVFDVPVSDIRGQMLELSGTNEYVEINNVATAIDGSTEFTLEAWINADATQTGDDRIISINTAGGGNVFLFFLDNGVLATFDGSDKDTYGTDLRGAGWHHVAVTHNNSRDSVYLDGTYMGSFTASVSAFAANNQWSIGQEFDGGSPGDYFKGKMDEIRIWKDVRTKKEIQESMHLTFSAAEIGGMENLVAYYQFDSDDAATTANGVKDILGNHGTIINGGTYSPSEVAVGAGVSMTKNVSAAGTYDFGNTDIELTFVGTVPNDDIVVTKITSQAVLNASPGEMANTVGEYWVIKNYGLNTGLDAEVQFNFTDGFINDNVAANHTIHKRGSNEYEAGDWTDETASSVSITAGNNHIKSASISSFSQFYVSATNSLPVELLHFNAKRLDNKTVQLNWGTASETNNRGFEIERKIGDKGEFEKVGWVEGNGTTTSFTRYQFKDDNNHIGTSYYRLKQLDFDGQFEYSGIVAVHLGNNGNIGKFYPNPSSDGRMNLDYVSTASKDITITIFDISGKRLHSQTENVLEGMNQLSFDFSFLNEGLYLINLNDGESITSRKIVIR